MLALLTQNQPDEAERFARSAMTEARAGVRRIKETELLMLVARIAEKRGQPDQGIHYLEQAIATAKAGGIQRLLADASAILADAYRARGDLNTAGHHARAAVSATQASGSRFTLPQRFRVLAEILAAQGKAADANRVYDQAADVIEGIMVNVPSREAQARLISVRSNLYEGDPLVDRFTQELRNSKGASPAASKELYEAILGPIPESQAARRVFVVPDGKLHLLAFDALLNLRGPESRIVSTLPSAEVFVLLRTRQAVTRPQRALMAIGGVPYDRMFASGKPSTAATRSDATRGLLDVSYPTQLPVLPTAQSEVLSAARLLGPTSTVLTGDQATESAVKALALGEFDVFHSAVHAFADPKFPERAALVLLSDRASGDDGLLQPREIGRFRLNAGVVVLSACDTAVGLTLGQEGVLNIARAFLLAGARSVITTLWAVSDATSMAVMRRFYENLAAGEDVASALARSKATVIEQFGDDARTTAAAFQLVGVGDHRVATATAGRSFSR